MTSIELEELIEKKEFVPDEKIHLWDTRRIPEIAINKGQRALCGYPVEDEHHIGCPGHSEMYAYGQKCCAYCGKIICTHCICVGIEAGRL